MECRLISGHPPHEPIVGFSREPWSAGEHVYVAGTAPIPADGSAPPEDANGQATCMFTNSQAGTNTITATRSGQSGTRTDTAEKARVVPVLEGKISPASATGTGSGLSRSTRSFNHAALVTEAEPGPLATPRKQQLMIECRIVAQSTAPPSHGR